MQFTKEKLEQFILINATVAMQQFKQCGGRFNQQIITVTKTGRIDITVVVDEVLHGHKMGKLITDMARKLGGVEAVIVSSDVAYKPKISWAEAGRIFEAQSHGIYDLEFDPDSQEALLTIGRCPVHLAQCILPYKRRGPNEDLIIFTKKPEIETWQGLETDLIPKTLWTPSHKVN